MGRPDPYRARSALAPQRPPGTCRVVVAYEADTIDPATHLGWSVVATGYARLVTDPEEPARHRRLMHP